MEKLTSFDFGTTNRKSEYDWDTLFNGEIYKLVEGTDFSCETQSFKVIAMSAARRRGFVLHSKIDGKAKAIVIRATPASEELKAMWAAEDADRKAKEKAKRAEKKKATPAEPETEERVPNIDIVRQMMASLPAEEPKPEAPPTPEPAPEPTTPAPAPESPKPRRRK